MGPLPLIAQIYMACAGFGTIFVLFTAAMGAAHSSGGAGGGHVGAGGHAHTGGHALTGGHAQAAGNAHAGGHAHTGGHGHAHSGGHALTGGHAHTGGNAHAGGHAQPSGIDNGLLGTLSIHQNLPASTPGLLQPSEHTPAAGSSKNSLATNNGSSDKLARMILTFCNPMLTCFFIAAFGSFGLILWKVTPLPIEWTLPLAGGASFVTTNLTMRLLGTMMSSMHASKTYSINSVIGCMAEVTVGINGGHMGEIMYAIGAQRYTAPARAAEPEKLLKRGDSVVIVDLRDDVAIVSLLGNEEDAFEDQLSNLQIEQKQTDI